MNEADTIKALRMEAHRLRRLAEVYPKADWRRWARDMEAVAATKETFLYRDKVKVG